MSVITAFETREYTNVVDYALQRGVSLSDDEIDALLTIGPDSR